MASASNYGLSNVKVVVRVSGCCFNVETLQDRNAFPFIAMFFNCVRKAIEYADTIVVCTGGASCVRLNFTNDPRKNDDILCSFFRACLFNAKNFKDPRSVAQATFMARSMVAVSRKALQLRVITGNASIFYRLKEPTE